MTVQSDDRPRPWSHTLALADMTRIPLLDPAAARTRPETLAAMQQRRGGQLGSLDQLLIHSEAVARGWNELFGALASECDIDMRVREIALLRKEKSA